MLQQTHGHGHDEGSGRPRELWEKYQNEPLMLRRRDNSGDPTEVPGCPAPRVCGSLNLDLDCRTIDEVGSDSKDVCSRDAVTGQGGRPVVPGQGRAHPVLPNRLRHLVIRHDISIAYDMSGSVCSHRV